MAVYCLVTSLALFCVPVLILLVGTHTGKYADTLSVVAQVVVSVFTLVFVLDVIGAALSYWEFRGQAERTEAGARNLISNGCVDEVSAIKMIQEYHVVRAVAPMIPTAVWKLHRARLDDLWSEYRAKRHP